MSIKFLFILGFYLHSDLFFSQIKIEGVIIEKDTKKPIEFASITLLSTGKGTISNSDGKFEIAINNIPDTLQISCIGFENKKIAVTSNHYDLKIQLENQTYSIKEVIIKPKIAVDVVKEAIEAIEANYISTPNSFKAYYRNVLRQNGQSVRLEEAICAFYHSGYAFKGIDPTESSFFDTRYKNYDGRGIYRYFDTHIDPKDKVEIIALRKSYDFSKSITKYYFTGGPLEILAYDKVKYKNEFLDVNNLKYYTFKIDSILLLGDREVYQVSFKPTRKKRLKTDDYRKQFYRRTYYAAEFTGKFFIDVKTKAFLRINYQIVKNKNITTPYPLKVDLSYSSIGNQYFLYSARCENQVEVLDLKKDKYDTWNFISTLLVDNDIETSNPSMIKDENNFSFSNGHSLYKYKKNYDENIWKRFNKIVPNENENKIISELEGKVPLAIQFKYPDKVVDDLFTKESFKSDYLYSIAHNTKSELYFNKYDTLTQRLFLNFDNRSKSKERKALLQIGEYYEDDTESAETPVIKKVLKDGQTKTIFNTDICMEKFPNLEYDDFSVSPDENFIAIFLADDNADIYTQIKIYNLKTKELVNSSNYVRQLAWINDSTILYSQHDTVSQKGKFIYYTSLKSFNNQRLIYSEEDPYMESGVFLLDSNYFAIHSVGYGYDELRVSSTDSVNLKLISSKKENVSYSIKKNNGGTYILKRTPENWELCSYSYTENKLEPIISLGKEKWVQDFQVTNKYFIFSILDNSFSKVAIYPKDNHISAIYADSINPMAELSRIKVKSYDDDLISVNVYTVPGTFEKIAIDLNKQSYQKETNRYFNHSTEYETKRLFVESIDKVKIPITIVYKKGLCLKNIPVVLEAYSSYGTNNFPQSDPFIIPLLEENVAYATAHVRGSGYNGIGWYFDGKLKNKPNGINDLLACCEYLVKEGITNENQLCLYARSAGGLIVGAAINRKPTLCKAVVYDQASLDLLSKNKEYDFGTKFHYYEWGSPYKKDELEIMKTYSPLQNLPEQYPSTYMIIGLNDKMVDPKTSLDFLRKLDTISNKPPTILAKIYEKGSHFGGLDDFQLTLMYTFVINEIKINGKAETLNSRR